jgi:transcriptional regulator with XRE-family HTH domain
MEKAPREDRRMVTQSEIARRVGLDVSSVNKILNRRRGPIFREKTIKKVFRIAQDIGYDFGRLKYHHRRRHPRKEMAQEARISIYREDGSLYDHGVAIVHDISLGGALISDVTLPMKSLPVGPFTVGLHLARKPADDVEISGRIVRLNLNDSLTYGIAFEKLDPAVEKKFRRITNG